MVLELGETVKFEPFHKRKKIIRYIDKYSEVYIIVLLHMLR